MENKKFLPKELLADVIHFVPFNLKWKDIRTSKLFDLFMIKFQQKCIIYLSSSKAEVLADYKSIINNLKSMDGHEKQFVLSEVFFIDNCFEPLYRRCLVGTSDEPCADKLKKKLSETAWPVNEPGWTNNIDLEESRNNYTHKREILQKLFTACFEAVESVDDPGVLCMWRVVGKCSGGIMSCAMRYFENHANRHRC